MILFTKASLAHQICIRHIVKQVRQEVLSYLSSNIAITLLIKYAGQ